MNELAQRLSDPGFFWFGLISLAFFIFLGRRGFTTRNGSRAPAVAGAIAATLVATMPFILPLVAHA